MTTNRSLLTFFLLSICLNTLIFAQAPRYCVPKTVTTNDGPNKLPKLPKEFQMTVEASLVSMFKTVVVNEYYTFLSNKGEIELYDIDDQFNIIFDFPNNQALFIDKLSCSVKKINESSDAIFFSKTIRPDGKLQIGSPSSVLHFDNGYEQIYVGDDVIRGIPVSHWRSCQDWPEINSNFIVDYYFSKSNYNTSVVWDSEIREVPVAAKVTGIADINPEDGTYRNFTNEYSFFTFQSVVVDDSERFKQPTGVYCADALPKKVFLKLPKQFKFTEEIVTSRGSKFASKFFYDYNKKAVRMDTVWTNVSSFVAEDTPISIIKDFNSGVTYVINRNLGNCTMLGINGGDLQLDTYEIFTSHREINYSFQMKEPNDFFYLDDSYYYAGESTHRGILCDRYVSNKLNVYIEPFGVIRSAVFEWYFLSQKWNSNLPALPIALVITCYEIGITITSNIYSFETETIDQSFFDVSQCFNEQQKTMFSIRFNYDNNTDKDIFQNVYRSPAEDLFNLPLYESILDYSFSPLRIIRAKIDVNENGFDVNSGVLDIAPPILQFTIINQRKIDLKMAKYVAPGISFENCARICLNSSKLKNDKFQCLSFDLCSNPSAPGYICSFYNGSRYGNEVQTSEASLTCDHYSKNSDKFDATEKEVLIKQIRNAVLENKFSIVIPLDNTTELVFPSYDFSESPFPGGNNDQSDLSSIENFIKNSASLSYNLDAIGLSEKYFVRIRAQTSAIDCARFCNLESAFVCNSFSYDTVKFNCSWSNIDEDEVSNSSSNLLVTVQSNTIFYLKQRIQNYIKFPFMVSTENNKFKFENVINEGQCAKICDLYTNFTCRSFNFCPSIQRCTLSPTHLSNASKSVDIIPNSLCNHYSKKAIKDFQLFKRVQVITFVPVLQLKNITVEDCAVVCVSEDSYLCRSFTYFIKESSCHLYKDNIVDGLFYEIKTTSNDNCNHYSRTYYEQNGIVYTIEPMNFKKGRKYSSGSILGVVLGLAVGSFVIGIIVGLIAMKIFKRPNYSVELKFKNQNYQ